MLAIQVATTEPVGAVPSQSAEAQPDAHESTILVVEDMASLRAVTARMLERAGYRVLTAASGSEALAVVGDCHGHIDVLLTDVIMPEMLGQDLAADMRERYPHLRVVFTSGFARPALENGGRAIDGPLLQKPIAANDLIAQIAEVLGAQAGPNGTPPPSD